jgi:hypothetical protein
MIFLDQHSEPNQIARTLWRELGPQLCLEIALTIATRSTQLRAYIIDASKLEEADAR